MFVFGGYDGHYRNDLYRYNFVKNSWTQVMPHPDSEGLWPKSRYRTSTTVYKDMMFLFGGHDGSRQLNDFYIFNFTSYRWTAVETETSLTPSSRDSHILVNSGNSIFLFGGSTGNPRSDFYEFKIESNKWSVVNSMAGRPPTSRFCHVGVVLKKKFFIFGGYDGDQRLNDFHYFLIDERASDLPPSTLIEDLGGFVGNKLFSDVTFIVEDQEVSAHKMMLVRSSYFQAMFRNNMLEKNSEKVTFLISRSK